MPRKKKWNEEKLIEAAKKSSSIRQVIFELGLIPAGGNYKQVQKYLSDLNIDIGHFRGKVWNKGLIGIGKPRKPLEQLLVSNKSFQSYKLKKRLIKAGLKKQECEECGWSQHSADGRIPLELHHINGKHNDNRLINLIILCPNCHSLKPNHRGRNIKK